VGCEKETRFLGFWGWLVGQRNRVSSVGIRSYLWEAGKKPGFWGSGVAGGAKKPGFFCEYQELSVGTKKETRFLGLWGWLTTMSDSSE